jgi:large subunit ribosomal protein L10
MAKNITHVSEAKKKTVKTLANLMKKKTVMVVSIKSLPSAQFQEIKKKVREKAEIMVAKRSLVDFALEHSGNESLKELVKFIDADCALLFTDDDAFIISGMLADSKTPSKAREGQIAEEDIHVEAGPTSLIPGPDISALSAVGLKVKVENGKIAVSQSAVLVKKGEAINAAKVAILAKLNITPFKIGLEPVAAYSGGKVYSNIKINKVEFMKDLLAKYARAFAFAVNTPWMTSETMPFILGKAAAHEKAIAGLIKSEDAQ